MQRIMGVDPGTRSMGVGVIEASGPRDIRVLHHSALQPGASKPMYQRLGLISEQLSALIQEFEPHVLVLEKSFCGDNLKTAISIGEARGVVLSLAGRYQLIFEEYAPTSVKSAIVGAGRASKEQVQRMVGMMLGIHEPFKTDDESDGLALALTYLHRKPRGVLVR